MVGTPLGVAAMLGHFHRSCQANRAEAPVSAKELHRIEDRGNGPQKGYAYSTYIFVGMMEKTWGEAKS